MRIKAVVSIFVKLDKAALWLQAKHLAFYWIIKQKKINHERSVGQSTLTPQANLACVGFLSNVNARERGHK